MTGYVIPVAQSLIHDICGAQVQPFLLGFMDVEGEGKGVRSHQWPMFFAEDTNAESSNMLTADPCKVKYKITDTAHGHASDQTTLKDTVVNPTQDSMAVARHLVQLFAPENTYVADLCAGSGTFAIAAVLEGRNALAFDTDKNQRAGFVARCASVNSAIEIAHEKARKDPKYDPSDPSFKVLPRLQ